MKQKQCHVYQTNTADISYATIMLTKIVAKISYFLLLDYQRILTNRDYFSKELNISQDLLDYYVDKLDYIHVLGRFDWIMNKSDQLKCIEYNAETPAFQMEIISSDERIYNQWVNYYINLYQFTTIKHKKQKLNIICPCNMFDEIEIRDTLFLERCLPFRIQIVDNLEFYQKVKWDNNQLLYNNQVIDVLWNINLPLHEINYQIPNFVQKLIDNKQITLWNSPLSSLYSNKYLYVLMHEIVEYNSNVLSEEEKLFIKKYIPYTTTNLEKFKKNLSHKKLVQKPIIGCCGEDVTIENIDTIQHKKGFIYQEYIEPSTVGLADDTYINLMSFSQIRNDIENIEFLGYGFKISEREIFNYNCEFISSTEYDILYKINTKSNK